MSARVAGTAAREIKIGKRNWCRDEALVEARGTQCGRKQGVRNPTKTIDAVRVPIDALCRQPACGVSGADAMPANCAIGPTYALRGERSGTGQRDDEPLECQEHAQCAGDPATLDRSGPCQHGQRPYTQ